MTDRKGAALATDSTVNRDQVDATIGKRRLILSRPFHELAMTFPLLEGREFDDLVADIAAHGVQHEIVIFEGQILEGRNRVRALQQVYGDELDQVEFPWRTFEGSREEAAAYVISANLHRRHLTAKQKRDIIAKLIKAAPEKSDLAISRMAKAGHPTVARVRKKLEMEGDVAKRSTSVDTKGRRQPTKKRRRTEEATTKLKQAYEGHRLRARALIVDLLDKGIREAAIKMLVSGEHRDRFAPFRDAVADLYQQLMKIGR
jgi:hypothetical protein